MPHCFDKDNYAQQNKPTALKFLRYGFVIMLLVLISCIQEPLSPFEARISVSNAALSLTSANPQEQLIIRNSGEEGSVLTWNISTAATSIIINPKEGKLEFNQEAIVSISADQTKLPVGTLLQGTIDINSNASNGDKKTVYIEFRLEGTGLSACGVSTPLSTSTPQSQVAAQALSSNQEPYVATELLVKYREPASLLQGGLGEPSPQVRQLALRSSEQSLALRYAYSVKKEASVYRPSLIKIPEGQDVLAYAERLARDPRVEYAEPNYYLETLAAPNDPLYAQQWNLQNFGLNEAWAIEQGSRSTVIAIIDSGVDIYHEDLVAKMLPGCDFYNEDNNPSPGLPNGGKSEHGTHVAGIAAATGNNAIGIAGVAYGSSVRILPIKVFDDPGVNGKVDGLIDAILWASGIPIEGVGLNSHPADVINMSLGVRPEFVQKNLESITDAILQAKNRGIVLFAASGNGGLDNLILSPANDPNVIAVGSVDDLIVTEDPDNSGKNMYSYKRSSFSNYASSGPTVDLMAPGGVTTTGTCSGTNEVLSTYPQGNVYGCLRGTSMASPFAAGVAALLLSQNPSLSPDQVKAKLQESAIFDAESMTQEAYGAGVICADKALGAATQCGR